MQACCVSSGQWHTRSGWHVTPCQASCSRRAAARSRNPVVLHVRGQAMHDFVAKCLNKDPAGRLSASELLRHPFLAHAKDERYLAQHLLGPPGPAAAAKPARTLLSRMPGGDTALVRRLSLRRCSTPGPVSFWAQSRSRTPCRQGILQAPLPRLNVPVWPRLSCRAARRSCCSRARRGTGR